MKKDIHFIINKSELTYYLSQNNGLSYTVIRGQSGILNDDNSITTLDSIISNFKETIQYTEDFIRSSFEDDVSSY